jgi:hypothetical protein
MTIGRDGVLQALRDTPGAVITATNALGMGIDIPAIRSVMLDTYVDGHIDGSHRQRCGDIHPSHYVMDVRPDGRTRSP